MYVRFCAALTGCLVSCAAIAYDYFEHRYLGNRAFDTARAHLEREGASDAEKKFATFLDGVATTKLRFNRKAKETRMAGRLLNRVPFQFGDLAAAAGDFVEVRVDETFPVDAAPRWHRTKALEPLTDLIARVEEIEEGSESWSIWTPFESLGLSLSKAEALIVSTRRQWLSACRWLYHTRLNPHGPAKPGPAKPAIRRDDNQCFELPPEIDRGAASPRLHVLASPGYHVSRYEEVEFERLPDYASLAADNRQHFPRHSWKAYSDHHERALELARCFRDKREKCGELKGGPDDMLEKALLHEAFAQHYLHDSFAAGHIGSKWGGCVLFACQPTKARLQQTHNVLNALGLDVRLVEAAEYLAKFGTKEELARGGWTSFGDQHLFIAEADFHRALVVQVATASLQEVFAHAIDPARTDKSCRMCTTRAFPLPDERFMSEDSIQEARTDLRADYRPGDLAEFERPRSLMRDERSRDERVPGIPHEGWKIAVGFARQLYYFTDGQGEKHRLADSGILVRIEHMRTVGSWMPNSLGFEYAHIPDRGSTYLGTAAYAWPVEVTKLQLAVKAKLGWRTEENFTAANPGEVRGGGIQLSIPVIEGVWEIYRPIAIFAQWNLFTYVFRKGFFEGGENYKESYFAQRDHSLLLGVRFDLAGF